MYPRLFDSFEYIPGNRILGDNSICNLWRNNHHNLLLFSTVVVICEVTVSPNPCQHLIFSVESLLLDDISLWFLFIVHLGLIVLSIFPCIYCTFVCPHWRIIYTSLYHFYHIVVSSFNSIYACFKLACFYYISFNKYCISKQLI